VKKHWGHWLLLLASCLPIMLARPRSNNLLLDTDTAYLLKKLTEVNNPWHWFTHDWPLGNHFYRPISTILFEFDHRLHQSSGEGFGLTQAMICCLATLSLAWLVTEFTKSLGQGIVAAWIFALWSTNGWIFRPNIDSLLLYAPPTLSIVVAIATIKFKKPLVSAITPCLGLLFLPTLASSVSSKLAGDTLFWLPGRTATSMTIFAFCSIAAYLRFERLNGERTPEPLPTALDLPATRTSSQAKSSSLSIGWFWYGISLTSMALALGCYEQAVMIPFVIIAAGFWLRRTGVQTRFSFQFPFWMILFAYTIARLQFVPIGPSGYQQQQFRSGPGVVIDLLAYIIPPLFPTFNYLKAVFTDFTENYMILLDITIWAVLLRFASYVGFWSSIKKDCKLPLLAIIMAMLAFLPMAFLKEFGHYHYFPAGFMVLALIEATKAFWKTFLIAVTPQSFQAPQRSHRAPGSLPHL
jgi:hypothetical protein